MRDYPAAFAALSSEATAYLLSSFRLIPPDPMPEDWLHGRIKACDAIVALSRSSAPWAIPAAEMLLGHAVTILPPGAPEEVEPALTTVRRVVDKDYPRSEEARFYAQRVVEVLPRRTRRPGWEVAPAVLRFAEIVEGRTVREMITRGVTKADITGAVRDGWLVLATEEAAA